MSLLHLLQAEGRGAGELGNHVGDSADTSGAGGVGDLEVLVKSRRRGLALGVGQDGTQAEAGVVIVQGDDVLASLVLAHVVREVEVGVEDLVAVLEVVVGEAAPQRGRLDDVFRTCCQRRLVTRRNIGTGKLLTLIDSRDEAQVAGATLESLPEVGILVRVGVDDRAVGQDDLEVGNIVASKAV